MAYNEGEYKKSLQAKNEEQYKQLLQSLGPRFQQILREETSNMIQQKVPRDLELSGGSYNPKSGLGLQFDVPETFADPSQFFPQGTPTKGTFKTPGGGSVTYEQPEGESSYLQEENIKAFSELFGGPPTEGTLKEEGPSLAWKRGKPESIRAKRKRWQEDALQTLYAHSKVVRLSKGKLGINETKESSLKATAKQYYAKMKIRIERMKSRGDTNLKIKNYVKSQGLQMHHFDAILRGYTDKYGVSYKPGVPLKQLTTVGKQGLQFRKYTVRNVFQKAQEREKKREGKKPKENLSQAMGRWISSGKSPKFLEARKRQHNINNKQWAQMLRKAGAK